jgi:hypothetical protein
MERVAKLLTELGLTKREVEVYLLLVNKGFALEIRDGVIAFEGIPIKKALANYIRYKQSITDEIIILADAYEKNVKMIV